LVITTHLHTTLQRRTPSGPVRRVDVTLRADSTLAELLEALDVEAAGDAILLVINGRLAEPEHVLCEGDEVHLIPAISGGAPSFPRNPGW
jgi:sulfur carrier protein ThiS